MGGRVPGAVQTRRTVVWSTTWIAPRSTGTFLGPLAATARSGCTTCCRTRRSSHWSPHPRPSPGSGSRKCGRHASRLGRRTASPTYTTCTCGGLGCLSEFHACACACVRVCVPGSFELHAPRWWPVFQLVLVDALFCLRPGCAQNDKSKPTIVIGPEAAGKKGPAPPICAMDFSSAKEEFLAVGDGDGVAKVHQTALCLSLSRRRCRRRPVLTRYRVPLCVDCRSIRQAVAGFRCSRRRYSLQNLSGSRRGSTGPWPTTDNPGCGCCVVVMTRC